MRSLLPTSVAAVTAAGLLLAPLALVAPAQAASAKHYTISVTGKGPTASIVATALTLKGTSPGDPTTIVKPKAHLPWKHTVSAKADLVEVVATLPKGGRVHCTIRDPEGKLVSESTGFGRHGVALCIVTSSDLAGLGGTGGSGSSTPPAS